MNTLSEFTNRMLIIPKKVGEPQDYCNKCNFKQSQNGVMVIQRYYKKLARQLTGMHILVCDNRNVSLTFGPFEQVDF